MRLTARFLRPVALFVAVVFVGCGRAEPTAAPQGDPPKVDPKPKQPPTDPPSGDEIPAELVKLGQRYEASVERRKGGGSGPTPVPAVSIWFEKPGPTDEQVAALAGELAKINARVYLNFNASEKVTPEGVAKLKSVPTVVGLDLGKLDPRALKFLEGMNQLEELHLSNDALTNADIALVTGLPGLKVLEVACEKVTPAVFADLAKLKELRGFRFVGPREWKVTDESLGHLKGLTKLEELEISLGAQISDKGMAQLKGLTKLRKFMWHAPGDCTKESLDVIAGWPDLEELKLPYAFAGADFARLVPLKKLKALEFSVSKGEWNAAFQHIGRVTSLEQLKFHLYKLTDADLAHLAGLTNLRELHSGSGDSEGQITDAGLAHLKGMTRLEKLFLWDNKRITDAGLAHLKPLVALKTLGVDGPKVTDAGMEHLKALPELEWLYATKTGITDKAADAFRQFPKLTRVYAKGTKMTKPAADALREEKRITVELE